MVSCINVRGKTEVLITAFTSFLLIIMKKAPAAVGTGSKVKHSLFPTNSASLHLITPHRTSLQQQGHDKHQSKVTEEQVRDLYSCRNGRNGVAVGKVIMMVVESFLKMKIQMPLKDYLTA